MGKFRAVLLQIWVFNCLMSEDLSLLSLFSIKGYKTKQNKKTFNSTKYPTVEDNHNKTSKLVDELVTSCSPEVNPPFYPAEVNIHIISVVS